MAEGPDFPKGRTVKGVVVNADLAPTIAAIAGARTRLPQDGRSLLPAARKPALLAGRGVLLEGFENPRGVSPYKSIRTQRYRYDLQPDGEEGLYDLKRDPWELVSKHDDPRYAAIKAILADKLAQLADCAGASCQVERGPAARAGSGGLSARDRIARRLVPGAIVALARVTAPARARARLRRLLGGRGRVELYFAFDDPCSAVAVVDLHGRLAGRRAELVLRPVVARGIPGDPAADAKRRFAVADARRLARRLGLALGRREPLAAESTAFLATWVAAAPRGPGRDAFCVAALRRLWLAGDDTVATAPYAALWREHVGGEPPAGSGTGANERRMRRRGPYDTPAAWIGGRWFFAHDRPVQIAAWVDALGWGEPA